MKKLLFVICVVLVSAGMLFAAGASEQKKEETKVALGSAPVTITFWHCASDDAGVLMDKYIKEFNETNKYQITVNAVYQGQYSDATTLMKTILSAENYSELPDIMQLDATGKVAFYDSGKAFTVDNAEAYFGEKIRDNYLEGALGNWEYSGAQLGLPFATSTTVTYYNKDLLAKAGWDHCPDTFADIIKLAADMKAAGITAAAYGTVPNSPTLANWIGQLGGYIVNFKNGSEASATKLECIESGTLKTFLTEWKAMYDAGALVNQSLSTNQFVAGEVAIFTNSSANVRNILNKVNGAFEVGASTYLRVNDSASYGATVSGSCLVMFDSEDALRKAATLSRPWPPCQLNSVSFDKGSISNTSSNHLIFCRPLHLLPPIFPTEMRWLDNIKLNGQELEQTPGYSGGQGSLECCSPWGHKESDTT